MVKKEREAKNLMKKGAVFAALFGCTALTACLFTGCFKNKEDSALNKNNILYTKKEGLYEYLINKNESKLLHTSYRTNAASQIQYSPNGKYLYYLEGNEFLYGSDTKLKRMEIEKARNTQKSDKAKGNKENKDSKEPDDSFTIAKDVEDFRVLKNGDVLYKIASGNKLYLWSGEDSDKISGEVEEYFLNKEENILLFYAENSYYGDSSYDEAEREGTLYCYDLRSKEKGKKKIQDDVILDKLQYSDDFSIIYYLKKEDEGAALYCVKDIINSDGNFESQLIDKGSNIEAYADKKTGELYYLTEEKDNGLYELLIDDDMLTDIENPATPEISEEDRAGMFESKEVIKDKGLKEYALQNMEDEFRKELKLALDNEYFGSVYYYNKEKTKQLAKAAVADVYDISDIAPVYDVDYNKNDTVSFFSIDKEKVEKIKFSELFNQYLDRLDKEMKTDSECSSEDEINVDKIIYEYYKDEASPLGKYFYYQSETSRDSEDALKEDRDKHGLYSDYDDEDSFSHSYDDKDISDEFNGIYEYNQKDEKCWLYEGTAQSIAYDFFNSFAVIQKAVLHTCFAAGDKLYQIDGDYVTDIYIDKENNKAYFTKLDDKTANEMAEAFNNFENYLDKEKLNHLYEMSANVSLNHSDLYKAELSEGGLGEAEAVDSEVGCIYGMRQGKLYYLKEEDDYGINATLYCEGKKIKSDFNKFIEYNESLYIQTGTNSEDSEATYGLYRLEKNNAEKIVIGAYDYRILPDGSVAYIANYKESRHRGELKLYKGREHDEVIDTEVMRLIGGERD